jgi:hypothetical protein
VEARVSPVGRAPEVIDHVKGEVPPAACSALEYDVPVVPVGKLDVETVSGAGAGAAMASESLTERVCAGLPPSLTATVKLLAPEAVGVPVIRPVAGARLSPAGRLPPVTDQVYGVVPPLPCTRFEYLVPLMPEGKDDVIIARAAGATPSVKVTSFVCTGLDESETWKVKLVELLVVGCPEMIPVDAARASP